MPFKKLSSRVYAAIYGDLIDIGGTDIHNGVATAGWLDMALFDCAMFIVRLGPSAWNAADQLDALHINQANTAIGGGTKALVPAKNLDQVAVNTLGEVFVLECEASDMDVENGFRWIRLECSEAGNTGVDDVEVCVVKFGARYQQEDLTPNTDKV